MERIHFMDSLRGTLMVMGVFLHTANIYHLDGTWLISDSTQSPVFNLVTDFIHTFRLPAFFIIAGYFCLYTYKHYGPLVFMVRRLTQLCIPLITTIITLNLLQTAILYYTNTATFSDHPKGWAWGFLTTGAWISHLWFLVFLIIYVIVFGAVMPLIERTQSFTTEWFAKHLRHRKWMVYILAPMFFVFLKAAGYLLPDILHRQFAGFSLISLMYYFYYFALGVILLRHENMVDSLVKVFNAVAFLGYLAGITLLDYLAEDSLLYKIGETYLQSLFSIILTFFIWQIFKNLFSKEIPFFTELSKSCYTIYLFHHLIVISLGVFFMQFDLSPFLKFFLISALTMIIAYTIHHHVILRYPIFKFLYNGKGYDIQK